MFIKYKKGDYPTTMQMYFDKYDENMYKELFVNYLNKFKLCKRRNKYTYTYNPNHKFYLNMTAYLILDPNTNEVISYAFEEFNDLVWIFQVLNIDGIKIDLPEKVFNGVKPIIDEYLSDRIEVL